LQANSKKPNTFNGDTTMTASKEFKLVRKTDNVITDEGSARKIRKLRKADPDKYFIGRSFAKNVGDKW